MYILNIRFTGKGLPVKGKDLRVKIRSRLKYTVHCLRLEVIIPSSLPFTLNLLMPDWKMANAAAVFKETGTAYKSVQSKFIPFFFVRFALFRNVFCVKHMSCSVLLVCRICEHIPFCVGFCFLFLSLLNRKYKFLYSESISTYI